MSNEDYQKILLAAYHKPAGSFDNQLRALIEEGVDINEKDHVGFTVIDRFLFEGLFDEAKILLENGAEISEKGFKIHTSLFSRDGNFKGLQFLAENFKEKYTKFFRDNINSEIAIYQGLHGDGLYQAIENDDAEKVRELLENGANIYSKYVFSFQRLDKAFSLAKPGSEVEKVLQEEKATVDSMKGTVLKELDKLSEITEITEEAKNKAANNIAGSLGLDSDSKEFKTIKTNIKAELGSILSAQKEHSHKNIIMRLIAYLMGYAPDKNKSSLKAAQRAHFTQKYLASKKKDRESKKER